MSTTSRFLLALVASTVALAPLSAQMWSARRAADENSRATSAALARELEVAGQILSNPDNWLTPEQRAADAASREQQARYEAYNRAVDQHRAEETARLAEKTLREIEARERPRVLHREAVDRGEPAAIIAEIEEKLTGRSATEPGVTRAELRSPPLAGWSLRGLRKGEFGPIHHHWMDTLNCLADPRTSHWPDETAVALAAPWSLDDGVLGVLLIHAGNPDDAPDLPAQRALFRQAAAGLVNARAANGLELLGVPNLSVALAALARRAQVNHPEFPFSVEAAALIDTTLRDAREGRRQPDARLAAYFKHADPFSFARLAAAVAPTRPAGIVPAPAIEPAAAHAMLTAYFRANSPTPTISLDEPFRLIHRLLAEAQDPAQTPGELAWFGHAPTRDLYLGFIGLARDRARALSLANAKSPVDLAATLAFDAALRHLQRPPPSETVLAWRDHFQGFTQTSRRAHVAALFADMVQFSPGALLNWSEALDALRDQDFTGPPAALLRQTATRAPNLFCTPAAARAALGAFDLTQSPRLDLTEQERAALRRLLGAAAPPGLTPAQQLQRLAVGARGLGEPRAIEACFQAAAAPAIAGLRLPLLDLGLVSLLEHTPREPDRLRPLLRRLTTTLADLTPDEIARLPLSRPRHAQLELIDALRRAESPLAPEVFPGSEKLDLLAQVAAVSQAGGDALAPLARYAEHEAARSVEGTTALEALTAAAIAQLTTTENQTQSSALVATLARRAIQPPLWWESAEAWTHAFEDRERWPRASTLRRAAESAAGHFMLYREQIIAPAQPLSADDLASLQYETLRAVTRDGRGRGQPMWELLGRDLAVGGLATRMILYTKRENPIADTHPFGENLAALDDELRKHPAVLPATRTLRELTAAALGDSAQGREPWPAAALGLGAATDPVSRSTLDLAGSLAWRREALQLIDEHAAQLPLTDETWPAAAPKDQQAAALRARVRWELSRLNQPALAPAGRAQPIAAGLGARAALVAFLYPASDNLTPARQLLFEGDRDFGRALLAAADPKLVPNRDELLRRFDALDLPRTATDWSALLAGHAW